MAVRDYLDKLRRSLLQLSNKKFGKILDNEEKVVYNTNVCFVVGGNALLE